METTKSDMLNTEIINIQTAFIDAMDTIGTGDYQLSLEKFEGTLEMCNICLKDETLDLKTKEMLLDLQQKCKIRIDQIEQYIESSNDINLSDSQILSNSSLIIGLGEDNLMLFSDLGKIGESVAEQKYWSGYLWDKMESLWTLLQPFSGVAQIFSSHQLQNINNITTTDAQKIVELEKHNLLLLAQLEQLRKANQPQGVQNLLHENTKLKRSIIDISSHIHRQSQIIRKTQLGESLVEDKPGNQVFEENNLLLLKNSKLRKRINSKRKRNSSLE